MEEGKLGAKAFLDGPVVSFSFRDMFSSSWGKVKGNIHIVLDIFHKRLQLPITENS
jgi:hypothetical protein